MSRVYNHWSEDDIKDIQKGKIPKSHPHHAACHTKAKRLGFHFHKAKIVDENWTQSQIDSLRAGKLPKGKSWNVAVKVANLHGIPFIDFFRNSPLSEDELKFVKKGKIPPHRRKADVIRFAAVELATPAFKSKVTEKSLAAARKGQALYLEFIAGTDSLEVVAKRHNMTKQNAHRLIQVFKCHFFDKFFVKDATENSL